MIRWEGGDQLTVEIVLGIDLLIDAVDHARLHKQDMLSPPRIALLKAIWSRCSTAVHYVVSESAAILRYITDKIGWDLRDWVGDTLHTTIPSIQVEGR